MLYLTNHKNINKWGLLLAIIIVSYFIISCTKNEEKKATDKSVLNTDFTNEEIIESVNKYPKLLAIIANLCGCNSATELDIGTPLLVIQASNYFISDNEYDYFSKYVYNTKTWYVPLKINDEIRCFAHVSAHADTLAFYGGGGLGLAERINKAVHKFGIKENGNWYFFQKDFPCFFLMIDSLNDFVLYPIGDSTSTFCRKETTYKVHNSFEDFFYSFK